jgi:hypothetical protein
MQMDKKVYIQYLIPVWHEVSELVKFQAKHKNWEQVSDQARDQVLDQVYDQVLVEVLYQVYSPIRQQVVQLNLGIKNG